MGKKSPVEKENLGQGGKKQTVERNCSHGREGGAAGGRMDFPFHMSPHRPSLALMTVHRLLPIFLYFSCPFTKDALASKI